jgi:hypothetical protein
VLGGTLVREHYESITVFGAELLGNDVVTHFGALEASSVNLCRDWRHVLL